MVDARGFSCPIPVVKTMDAVKKDSPATLEVMVDDPCAVENITRYASNNGYSVSVSQDGEDFTLTLTRRQ